jgi:uncharacterized protein YfiM (DUF2279 family)
MMSTTTYHFAFCTLQSAICTVLGSASLRNFSEESQGLRAVSVGFLTIFLVFGMTVNTCHSEPNMEVCTDPWLGPDKVNHAVGSAVVTGIAYQLLVDEEGFGRTEASCAAATMVLTLGVIKEFRDLSSGPRCFSAKDLLADAVGIVFVLIIYADGL